MRSFLAALVASTALASAALAADLPARPYTKAAVAPVVTYDWSGFYVGAHVGGAFRGDDNFVLPTISGTVTGQQSSFIGGGQAGFNFMLSPNWLLGVEGDISAISDGGRRYAANLGAADFFTTRTDWLASATGRLGYVSGALLIYAKGGAAFRDNGEVFINSVTAPAPTRHNTGWTAGGGVEYMFAPAWSAKAEYQYYEFGQSTVSAATGIFSLGGRYDENFHTVKVGVNYHFNWGGAKY